MLGGHRIGAVIWLAASVWAAVAQAETSPTCSSFAAFRSDRESALAPGAASEGAPASPELELARAYVGACSLERTAALARTLIRIPTVGHPQAGEGAAAFAALRAVLTTYAAEHGLTFNRVGNDDAWEIALGSGPFALAFIAHADVVPAAPSSNSAADLAASAPAGDSERPGPFEGGSKDGRLYGRGAQDDKGPLAAALVTLAMLRETGTFGLSAPAKIAVVIGTSEETDWAGMTRYAGTRPLPAIAISVDDSFPVVVGQDGFVAWHLGAPIENRPRTGRATVVDAGGGTALTQVPAQAWMAVTPAANEKLDGLARRVTSAIEAERRLRERSKYSFCFESVLEPELGRVVVRTFGVAAHSSTPEEGSNALWPLASIATRLGVESDGFGAVLRVLASRLDGDHLGQKLGLAYKHATMGPLIVAPTLLRVEGQQVVLSINMRRPAGVSSSDFGARLDGARARLQRDINKSIVEVGQRFVGEPTFMDPRSRVPSALLDIYRRLAGDVRSQAKTIRGSSYSRLFPNGLAFGPARPGTTYRGHTEDEYIELGELEFLVKALFEAAVTLGLDTGERGSASRAGLVP